MSESPPWRVAIPILIAVAALSSLFTTCGVADRYNDQAIRAFNGLCNLTKQGRPITNRRSFDLAEFIDSRADSEARNLQLLRVTLGHNLSHAQFERLADVRGRQHDIDKAHEVAKLFRITFPVTKTFCADVLAGKPAPPVTQRQRSTTTSRP